jgi:hypothetical protein
MSTLSYDATGAAQKALEQHLPALVEDRIAARIFAKDHTLWGPDAESESAIRLGWVEAATVSQPLVKDILELRDALRAEGVTRIVLCGTGGFVAECAHCWLGSLPCRGEGALNVAEQFLPAGHELVQAFGFEDGDDVVVGDAELLHSCRSRCHR